MHPPIGIAQLYFFMRSAFLNAEWRKLAIANFSIDPLVLKSYLPYGTELDFWNGKCYVSLVGFRFMHTRLKGISIPFHSDFEEINLRFYVKYRDKGIWKRGVTFIKEIVPRRALSFVANSIYKEKYVTLPTKHEWIDSSEYIKVTYMWRHHGAWDSISLAADPIISDIAMGSEEEFITEHYWGYTQLSNNRTSQYQVEHPRWQTYPVKDYQISVRFQDLYGAEFGFLNSARPDSIMLAEGSKIIVRLSDKIE